MTEMRFNVGFGTDMGHKRKQNQDHGGAYPELGLFLVSDGMGGHRGGETASSTAVDVITSYLRKTTQTQTQSWNPKTALTGAIEAANQAIFEHASKDSALHGMGTTTTALLFKGSNLTIGHVGDSRCYFFRHHAVWQVTRDHSLVQEKLRSGLITRSEVNTDRMKNVITRSVGFEKEVAVEIYQMDIQSGDCFLICSDGLSNMINDLKILDIIQSQVFEYKNIQKAVDDLIATANAHGGDDNITCIVIQVTT